MVDHVDYAVLDEGKSVYSKEAEIINEVIAAIDRMNSELANGWSNNSARAFLDSYESTHKPALRNVQQALEGIAKEISSYSDVHSQEDREHANQMR